MLRRALAKEVLFVDETPLNLQSSGKVKQAYMWVVAGGDYRVYAFYPDRKHANAVDLLKNYHGILHSDKYGAYETLAAKKQFTWCSCWAHIRRKFYEADTGDPPFRAWVLRKIRYLHGHDLHLCPRRSSVHINLK